MRYLERLKRKHGKMHKWLRPYLLIHSYWDCCIIEDVEGALTDCHVWLVCGISHRFTLSEFPLTFQYFIVELLSPSMI